jgi:hypothetical protein
MLTLGASGPRVSAGLAARCNNKMTKTALRFRTLLLHDSNREVHFERVTPG